MRQSSPPVVITESSQLKGLAERLAVETRVGVDTESNSLHAYKERVCLVQFSTPNDDFLIDPLAVEDLSPLAPIFGEKGIEKIFHAAEYDLIVLQRDYGFPFVNLFDTMMAARILGRKRVGLGNLLEEEFDIQLEKKFQRADWGKRPLPQPQLEYARMDTRHLIELRDRLKAELGERGRWELAREDFVRLPSLIRAGEPVERDVWSIKGARDLDPKQAAVLQELAIYREARAVEADLPLFKIIGDSTLIALAKGEPRTPKELEPIAGMTPGQIQRHGKAMLDAVQRGLSAPPLRRPRRGRYEEDFVERLDALRAWRKSVAKEMEVESDVVLPRDVMHDVARANPRSIAELEPLLESVPWRMKNYGEQIVKALKK